MTTSSERVLTSEVIGDLYGTDDHFAPLGETLGVKLDTIEIPEDRVRPGQKYVFGADVAEHFEEQVISKQIPGYAQMRLRCVQMGHLFVQPHTDVLDLGTSRGKMIRDLIASYSIPETNQPEKISTVRYVGVDSEDEMLTRARTTVNELFTHIGCSEDEATRVVELVNWDLRNGIPASHPKRGYSLVTAILTLQFVPMEHRARIVTAIYDALVPGGAFIFVEKVVGNSLLTDDLLTKVYYDDKRRNGMTEDAIIKKRESIEGFLVPLRSEENRHLLHQAGFTQFRIETFWRDLQFEAILAIK